jgi:hypothetical protein
VRRSSYLSLSLHTIDGSFFRAGLPPTKELTSQMGFHLLRVTECSVLLLFHPALVETSSAEILLTTRLQLSKTRVLSTRATAGRFLLHVKGEWCVALLRLCL